MKKIQNQKNQIQIGVTVAMAGLLFLFMIVYLLRFEVENRTYLISNNYNNREATLEKHNYRGTIYSKDGEVLAYSEVSEDQVETRVYPYANAFAHIVGYSGKGRMGVESYANYYLINTGTDLHSKVNNDVGGIKNPGHNVYTTLDVNLQQIADNYLSSNDGAVIMTEVKTGRVLAMVSHPDFDPNQIDAIWEQVTHDASSSVLVNRATQGLYPPGSTFKIFSSLEYYRENGDDWKEYAYHCNGIYTNGEYAINCYHGTVHGDVDFAGSFAKSCNASFANIGMGLNRNRFADTLEELYFGKELPTDLLSSVSRVNVSKNVDDFAMMQTSIGQGTTSITPLHLHMITQTIADHGILMKPYVIEKIENDRGDIVKSYAPEKVSRLMTEEESVFLTDLMKGVVESGTATRLQSDLYTAAGKTGSAEYGNVKGQSHAWFTGFAPAEDPQVCVTIIIEGAGSGGEYAVPLAKRMFDHYFTQE